MAVHIASLRNSKLCRTPLASIPSQSTHWEDLWVPEEHAMAPDEPNRKQQQVEKKGHAAFDYLLVGQVRLDIDDMDLLYCV